MMAHYHSQPAVVQTAAYPHESRFLHLHSFSPSASSLPPTPSSSSSPTPPLDQDLEVLCTLFTHALANPKLAPSFTLPKTIRITFSSLPLGTKVAQAPPGAIATSEEDEDGAQALLLRCKIPTRQQVEQSGTVIEEDGKVALYCELIARSPQGEDTVVDRVWFGDFDFNGNNDQELAAELEASSRKRAASPFEDDDTARFRVRYSTHPTYEAGPPSDGYGLVDAGAGGGLNVQFGNGRSTTYSGDGIVYTDHSPDPGYLVDQPHPSHLHPFQPQSFHPHTPTSLSPPSPYEPTPPMAYAPHPDTSNYQPSYVSYQQPSHAYLPPPPPPPPQPQQQPRSRETSASASKGIYGERAAEGTKASLIIHGDLFSMAVGWTEQEWQAKRRLVQFWRKMEGSVIHASFAPIRQEDYEQRSIVISCIFREETNECYVTSVDAIYLLEGLIGARFSIEEKNRVRRNLQRCKPDTISKMKPQTEDFFSVLMNFPTPKPRHIEKDIKVFKWKDFGPALERTVSKYSIGPTDNSQIPSPPLPAHEGGSDEE